MARVSTSDPIAGYKFTVTFEGISPAFGFSKVNGLESGSVEVQEYREGTDPDYDRKLPGKTKYSAITLERGMSLNDTAYNQLFARFSRTRGNTNADVSTRNTTAAGSTPDYDTFRFSQVTFEVRNRMNDVVRTYVAHNCFISSMKPGDLDATSSGVLIDTLVLETEYVTTESTSSSTL